jgi:hypothetical protein
MVNEQMVNEQMIKEVQPKPCQQLAITSCKNRVNDDGSREYFRPCKVCQIPSELLLYVKH